MDLQGLYYIQDYSFYINHHKELQKEFDSYQKIMSKELKKIKKRTKTLHITKCFQKEDPMLINELRDTRAYIIKKKLIKKRITEEFINKRFSINNYILRNNKKIDDSYINLLTYSIETNPFIQ